MIGILRKGFWVVAILIAVWNVVDFFHALIEIQENKDTYKTVYSETSYLITGILHATQYIFYGEALALLHRIAKRGEQGEQ
ncbi:hypothetical protein ACFQ49_06435 [Kroppenstedtia eburnea]|uniref:hypothetical protein n=1 Tax=Kroppenstedtia eburnea TaxID=714067 RepID=UPI00363A050F